MILACSRHRVVQVLHRDPKRTAALGGSGTQLGYGGLENVIAVQFAVHPSCAEQHADDPVKKLELDANEKVSRLLLPSRAALLRSRAGLQAWCARTKAVALSVRRGCLLPFAASAMPLS